MHSCQEMWTSMATMFIMSFIFIVSKAHSFDKRLLFNDPQSIQTMLHNYEVQLNKYGNALQELENKVSAIQTEKTALTLELLNATNSIGELQRNLCKLETEKTNLLRRIDVLESENNQGESTFIRWGRKTCSDDNQTELVYSGIVGGSYYDHTGSGVDYLCLPHNPNPIIPDSALKTSSASSYALLYGGEYEMNFKNVRYDDVVPCAVCHTKGTVLMIPAKLSCPSKSWKMMYNGVLVANHYNFKSASRFVCMDANPEYMEGTRTHNDNGKLFSPVKTVCGSLPCPPYAAGEIVSCVVCTN